MKAYTQQEIKAANKIAHNYLFSPYCFLSSSSKPFSYDKRTRIGNLANTIVCAKSKNINKQEVLKKQHERRQNKKSNYTPYLQNPLLVDYKKNIASGVFFDKITFYGRNHWAKNPIDFKILEILQKNFMLKINKIAC